MNRQKGSGTRVLLDLNLKRLGIAPSKIRGYEIELDTHIAVGSEIAQGRADAGLGIEAAARSCGIGFMPLFREKYDLAMPATVYRSSWLAPLLEIIRSSEFKKIVDQVEGYDTSETGTTIFL